MTPQEQMATAMVNAEIAAVLDKGRLPDTAALTLHIVAAISGSLGYLIGAGKLPPLRCDSEAPRNVFSLVDDFMIYMESKTNPNLLYYRYYFNTTDYDPETRVPDMDPSTNRSYGTFEADLTKLLFTAAKEDKP